MRAPLAKVAKPHDFAAVLTVTGDAGAADAIMILQIGVKMADILWKQLFFYKRFFRKKKKPRKTGEVLRGFALREGY
jgi:hypothetical protein